MKVEKHEINDAIFRIKKDKFRKKLPTMHKIAGNLPVDHPLHSDHRITYVSAPPPPQVKTCKAVSQDDSAIMRDAIARLQSTKEEDRPFNALPISAGGLSAGADDPLVGILDFSGANSISSVGALSIETSPSFDGLISLDAENIKSFNEINSQMDQIQKLLPTISDVNRRAELINKLAPELESAMTMLEDRIKQ